jgi:acyl-CoA reductase-like NAD-dependent aldehyde dehydrogenase
MENSPPTLHNFIGGCFVEPAHGQYLEGTNPATGELLYLLPNSTEEDVNAAVSAGLKAFPAWSATSRSHRAKLLHKMADLLESRIAEFGIIHLFLLTFVFSGGREPRSRENFETSKRH